MKMTIRQYHYFGRGLCLKEGLINKGSWDAVRLGEGFRDPAFMLPADRQSWQLKCESSLLHQRAKDIAKVLASGYTRLASCGVGSACLEYLIKKECPCIFLVCSDFAPRTVMRLRGLFTEADEVAEFDMLNGEWKNNGRGCLYLMHRIDTEFDDKQLRRVFGKMHSCGIENILFIPSEFLTLRKAFYHLLKRLLSRFFGKGMVFAGYLRTKGVFDSFFRGFYDIEYSGHFGGLCGYLLKRKE